MNGDKGAEYTGRPVPACYARSIAKKRPKPVVFYAVVARRQETKAALRRIGNALSLSSIGRALPFSDAGSFLESLTRGQQDE